MSDDDYIYGPARQALRAERVQLERDAKALIAEADGLRGSTDPEALRVHGERLRQHRARVREYRLALERFQACAADWMAHEPSGGASSGLESVRSFWSDRAKLKKSAS